MNSFRDKKWSMSVPLLIVFLMLAALIAGGVVAKTISLNSPTAFPVDI